MKSKELFEIIKRHKIITVLGGVWGFVNGILLMLGYISPAEHHGEFVVTHLLAFFPAFIVNEIFKIVVPILLPLKDILSHDIHPLIIIIPTLLFIIALSTAIGLSIGILIGYVYEKIRGAKK